MCDIMAVLHIQNTGSWIENIVNHQAHDLIKPTFISFSFEKKQSQTYI